MEYSNRSLELIGKQFLYSCIDVYLKLAVHLAAGHCLYWRPSDMEERGKQWHYLWALAVSFSWSCRAETWTKSQWHHGISCILWHDMARRRKLRCRLKNAQECRPLKHGSSHAATLVQLACACCASIHFDSLEITLLVWIEDTSFPGPASDARISMVLTKMQWMRKSFHSIHLTLTRFFSVIRVVSGGRYRPEQFNTKA